jgi:hypothetical protein
VWSIIEKTPQFRTELERVRPLREMISMPAWHGQPLATCQAAVAGLVWLTLAAPGQRRPLCFYEYALSVPGLRRFFRQRAAQAESTLAVLTAEPYLQCITSLDAVAKKALDLLAKAGREALGMAKTHGWMSSDRPEGVAKLLEWVLASDSELQASREAVRLRYAVCGDARLDAWLRGSTSVRVELALLAARGRTPYTPEGRVTVGLGDGRAYLARYGTNPKPGRETFDGGSDLLVVDATSLAFARASPLANGTVLSRAFSLCTSVAATSACLVASKRRASSADVVPSAIPPEPRSETWMSSARPIAR